MFQQKDKSPESIETGGFRSRAENDTAPTRGKAKNAGNLRKDKPDPMLPEKKRARRRLIGAVALVIAAVIGLPMLLDPEPKPLTDDIAIQIPSKDKSSTTGALAAPVQSNKSAPVEPAEEVLEPAPASAVVPRPAAKPLELREPGNLTGTQRDANAAVSNTAKLSEKLTVKPEPKSGDKSDNKTDNMSTSVTSDVKKATGVKSSTKSDASSATAASDETNRALAILDGKPQVKTSEKTTEKLDKVALADKQHSHYLVQVAALSTPEKIHELQDKLKAAGIKSYTQKVVTASGEISRIRVGPFSSKSEAEKAQSALVKSGLNGTIIPN